MIVEFVSKGHVLRARNEENEDCYPLWGVFSAPSKLTNQILENFITTYPGAYSRTEAGEDENEKDPQ
jgi:hypothetical protein